MGDQTYWVSLGHGISEEKPHYAQSIMHLEQWKDSAMRANSTAAVIEITFNPKTGGVSATLLKNEKRR